MRVFHGSNVVVERPRILTDGHTKDFGYGFYCTSYEQQAIKWALAKFKYPTHQIVFCTERALAALEYIGSNYE